MPLPESVRPGEEGGLVQQPQIPLGTRSPALGQQLEEGGAAREAAVPLIEGGLDAGPGLAGRLRNWPRADLRPVTVTRAEGIRPGQDLVGGQRRQIEMVSRSAVFRE